METTRTEVSFDEDSVIIDCQSFKNGEIKLQQPMMFGSSVIKGDNSLDENLRPLFNSSGKMTDMKESEEDIDLELEKELLGETEDFTDDKNCMTTEEERSLLNGNTENKEDNILDVDQFFADLPSKVDDSLNRRMQEIFEGKVVNDQEHVQDSMNKTEDIENILQSTNPADKTDEDELEKLLLGSDVFDDFDTTENSMAEPLKRDKAQNTEPEQCKISSPINAIQCEANEDPGFIDPINVQPSVISKNPMIINSTEGAELKVPEAFTNGGTNGTSMDIDENKLNFQKKCEGHIDSKVSDEFVIGKNSDVVIDSTLVKNHASGLEFPKERSPDEMQTDLETENFRFSNDFVLLNDSCSATLEGKFSNKIDTDPQEHKSPSKPGIENEIVCSAIEVIPCETTDVRNDEISESMDIEPEKMSTLEETVKSAGNDVRNGEPAKKEPVLNEKMENQNAKNISEYDPEPENQKSADFRNSDDNESRLLKSENQNTENKNSECGLSNPVIQNADHYESEHELTNPKKQIIDHFDAENDNDTKMVEIESFLDDKMDVGMMSEKEEVSFMVAEIIDVIMNGVSSKIDFDRDVKVKPEANLLDAEAKDFTFFWTGRKHERKETDSAADIVDSILEEILDEIVPEQKTSMLEDLPIIDFSLNFDSEGLDCEGLYISKLIVEDLIDEVVFGKYYKSLQDAENSSDDGDGFGGFEEPEPESEEDIKPDILDPTFVPQLMHEIITSVIRNTDKDVIVRDIINDMINDIIEPSVIVRQIINDMLKKIVPNEIGLPSIVLEVTTIPREAYERMRSATPPRKRTSKRLQVMNEQKPIKKREKVVKVASPVGRVTRATRSTKELDIHIKEEPVDLPPEEEPEDIKPIVPPPEEIMKRSRRSMKRNITPEPETYSKSSRRRNISPEESYSKSSRRRNTSPEESPPRGRSRPPKVVVKAKGPPPARRGVPVPPPVIKVAKPIKEEKMKKQMWKIESKKILPPKPVKKPVIKPVKKTKEPSPPPPKRIIKRKSSPIPARSTRASTIVSPTPVSPSTSGVRTRKSSPAFSFEELPLSKRSRADPSEARKRSVTPIRNIALKSTSGRPTKKTKVPEPDPIPGPSYSSKRKFDGFDPLSYKKQRQTVGISIRSCAVRMERSLFIDRLLPSANKKDETIFCELCEPRRLFLSKKALVDHLKTEHAGTFASESSRPPVTGDRCPGCDKKYHSHNRLEEHMKVCPAVAMGAKPPIRGIQVSKSVFATPSSSKQVEEELKYPCDSCNSKYSTWSGLEAHKRLHWTVEDPLTLETEPDSAAGYKAQINRRGLKMTITRNQERFRCNVCSAPFDNKNTLKLHKLIHNVKVKQERVSPDLEILEEYIAPPVPAPAAPQMRSYSPPPPSPPDFVDEYVPPPRKRRGAPSPPPRSPSPQYRSPSPPTFYDPVNPMDDDEPVFMQIAMQKPTARKSTGGVRPIKAGPASAKSARMSAGPLSTKVIFTEKASVGRPGPLSMKATPPSRKPGPLSSKGDSTGLVSPTERPGPMSTRGVSTGKPGPLSSKTGGLKIGPPFPHSDAIARPGPLSSKVRPGPLSSKTGEIGRPGPLSSKMGPSSTRPGPMSSKSGPATTRAGPLSSKPGPMSARYDQQASSTRLSMPGASTRRPSLSATARKSTGGPMKRKVFSFHD